MNSLFLGMDVSKGYADCVVLDEQKHIVHENFQIDDTFDGHHALFLRLQELFHLYPGTTISAGLESTGGFEDNWYAFLFGLATTHSIRVARLNPRGVMHHGKADLKRVTTDKISARSIAEYLINYPEKVRYNTTDMYASLRKEWKFIERLTLQRVQLLNQLQALLYSANPGMLNFWKEKVATYVLLVLVKYPLARDLARARISSLSRIPYLGTSRANTMIDLAKQSVASRQDPTIAHTISSLARHILSLDETISMQTDHLISQCPFPEIGILTSFTGIAEYSAIGLFLSIISIDRFPSVKDFASFFGVHPVFKQSGDGIAGIHMSKQGSPLVRSILFMVSMNAIVHNPLIKEIYDAAKERGMAGYAALGLVMHKILRIIYGMLKHRMPFNPEIDRQYRKRHRQQDEPVPSNPSTGNRRFQSYDATAPISHRQNKMRKEQAASQNDFSSSYTGSSTHSLPGLGKRKIGRPPMIVKQKIE